MDRSVFASESQYLFALVFRPEKIDEFREVADDAKAPVPAYLIPGELFERIQVILVRHEVRAEALRLRRIVRKMNSSFYGRNSILSRIAFTASYATLAFSFAAFRSGESNGVLLAPDI